MYQGKFDSKNKQATVDVSELVAQRNSAPAKKPAPAREPVPVTSPIKENHAKKVAEQEAPVRKGPRTGGVIFYTFYFMFILLFFVATYFGLQWLHGWLSDYEAAQPTVKCQEVFDQLFADPDWDALYDMSGIEDTEYEGKEEFVSYMETKIGENELTFQETSAGLSGDKKYFVMLDKEKIASFTLEGESESITDIPDWQLGTVELFYEREERFFIRMMSGQTAFVNGKKLDDSFTIQIASTKAESSGLLPTGTTGAKVYTQKITGLMAVPTVTIQNADGSEAAVTYDPETETFATATVSTVMSDEEKEVALNAIKAYAKYQIKEASSTTVAKYFDSRGDAYSSIMETVLAWTKRNAGYSFANDTVSGYTRYSEDLFSVYVTTEMTINLTDGGTQVKPINATLLFQKQGNNWKVVRMTNADISEPVGEVRLTFLSNDEVLDSRFVENDIHNLTTPLVSAPEGKVFVGWIAEIENEEGKLEWTLVFTPEENGNVSIPTGTILQPMDLYAYFEAAPADTTTEGAE